MNESLPFKSGDLDRNHRFLAFADVKPLISETNRLAAYIINIIIDKNYSKSKLRKIKDIYLNWEIKEHKYETLLTLERLSEHMRSRRCLDESALDLPKIECDWLDRFPGIAKADAPIVSLDGKQYAPLSLPMSLGNRFPLAPCIDREGVAYRTLQTPILLNIYRLYYKLIENSHLAVTFNFSWLNDLRMLLNECVTAVDVTLHQLYFMAQYGDKPSAFKFDEGLLGPRHVRRLSDKFRWIGVITGKPLDNAQDEIVSFSILKDLRNHLSHFDPPCFAYTMEDAVSWLNRVSDVGRLLWRIREKLRAQISDPIIRIILLPQVEFRPRSMGTRVPQPPNVGYGSTNWSRLASATNKEPTKKVGKV